AKLYYNNSLIVILSIIFIQQFISFDNLIHFFFSSRRRHTRSVSAFLLNRSSDLMSNIQTGAERMPHDLSHLGFLAGQIGRLITISATPVIAGDSFEMDAVGALRLSPLRRGLAIDSTVDIFTFYVPHRH